ncbi:MAG: hypothetical protein A2W22_03905 [Candidatus Levybacteria bacterium RBG_16_35_11]|nr:MAG: hypothetical protein A2W22_03905 [Candidatus Levybacteria bacterium RBG_16_35_11]
MGILVFLFAILYILIFPIGELLGFTFIKSANLSLLDVFTFIIFLFWLITSKKKGIKNSLSLPIAIFIGILFLSFIINMSGIPLNLLTVAFLYIVRWLLYLSVFFVLINSSKRVKNLVPYFMSGGGLIVVIIGYFQYFLFPSLQSLYKYGWDEHLYRLFSSFLDPNFCGIIISLVFILNFYFLRFFKKGRFKIVFFTLQFLIFVALLLTYSRSALITLIVSIITFLILEKRMKIAIVFIAGCIISVFLLSSANPILELKFARTYKTEGTNFLRTTSVQARVRSIKDGLTLFSKYPVFGVGFNNLRYAQYKSGIIGGPNWETTHAGGGTDNSFLFVAETTGIVGLGAYLFLLYSIFRNLLKKRKGKLAVIAISSLSGVIVGTFFINGLFYPFIMLWLWSLIGITLNT